MEISADPFVFTAISRGGGDGEASDIIIWQKKTEKAAEQHTKEAPRSAWNGFRIALHICMWVTSIAFLLQNFGVRVRFLKDESLLINPQVNAAIMEKIKNYLV